MVHIEMIRIISGLGDKKFRDEREDNQSSL